MRLNHVLSCALLAACLGAPAFASTCQIDSGATCPSAMPLGGYCECNVGGMNMGGTIISEGSTRGTARPFQPGAPNGGPGQNLGGYQGGYQAPPPPRYAPQSYAPQGYAPPQTYPPAPAYPPPAYPPQSYPPPRTYPPQGY